MTENRQKRCGSVLAARSGSVSITHDASAAERTARKPSSTTGVADRGDLPRVAVVGGVREPEQFGGQRLIGRDGLRQLVRGKLLAAGDFDHARGDRWKRAQLGDLIDEEVEFGVAPRRRDELSAHQSCHNHRQASRLPVGRTLKLATCGSDRQHAARGDESRVCSDRKQRPMILDERRIYAGRDRRQKIAALAAEQVRMAQVHPIPTLPAVHAQALGLLSDPSTSIPQLGQVVETDPALTVSVLRAANSAASAPVTPIGHRPRRSCESASTRRARSSPRRW